MKKWKKVLIIVTSTVVVLGVAGVCTYKFYIEPKILEPALEKVQKVLNDEKVQGSVDEIVQEMLDTGYLAEEDLSEYYKYQEYKNNDAAEGENAVSESGTGTVSGPPVPENYKRPEKKKNTSENSSKSTKKMSLIERARAEMTADEFAFSMSVYNRIDVGYVTANMYTDRAAVKQYVYSRMSKAEVSRALSLYSKYSYILRN